MLLDIFSISLQGVAQSVFSLMFVMLVWIIYMLVKKLGQANVYNYDQARTTFSSLVELAMHGTIAGFILGFVLIVLGMPIQLSPYLLILVPLSLLLGMSNIRYLCMSYAASILGVMALLFNGQSVLGVILPDIDIEVSGLVALVGALHVIEGTLIILYGDRDAIPIVSKHHDQIVLGHIVQRYWPVPFAALVTTTGVLTGGTVEMPNWWPLIGQEGISETLIFMPLSMVGIIGYSTITFAQSTKKRMRQSGAGILVYGILLMVLGYVGQGNLIVSIIGVIAMAGLHELVIALELLYENHSKPLYPLPEKGIRIMVVNEGSIAQQMGLEIGDLVQSVNDIEVTNIQHFKAIMKQKYVTVKLHVLDVRNQIKVLEYTSPEKAITALGIKMIPEKPPILFKYTNMLKIGMLHLMRNRNIKK